MIMIFGILDISRWFFHLFEIGLLGGGGGGGWGGVLESASEFSKREGQTFIGHLRVYFLSSELVENFFTTLIKLAFGNNTVDSKNVYTSPFK